MASPMEAVEFTPNTADAATPFRDPSTQQLLQKYSLQHEFRHAGEAAAARDLVENLERKELECELWMEHALATTREYREEGDRLAEQLEVIGMPKDVLDKDAATNLEFVANAAEILGTREAGSQEILLCWTDLVIDDIERCEEQRHLAKCLSTAKRETERAAEVASQMKYAVNLIRKKNADDKQFREEAAKFKQQSFADANRAKTMAEREKEDLKSSGYTDKIRIDVLMAELQNLKEAKLKLERLQKRKAVYHDLPLDVEGARVMLNNAQQHCREVTRNLQTKTV